MMFGTTIKMFIKIKLLLCHTRVQCSSPSFACDSRFLQTCTPGGSRSWLKCTGPWHAHRRPTPRPRLLASTWTSPGSQGHLGVRQQEGKTDCIIICAKKLGTHSTEWKKFLANQISDESLMILWIYKLTFWQQNKNNQTENWGRGKLEDTFYLKKKRRRKKIRKCKPTMKHYFITTKMTKTHTYKHTHMYIHT